MCITFVSFFEFGCFGLGLQGVEPIRIRAGVDRTFFFACIASPNGYLIP